MARRLAETKAAEWWVKGALCIYGLGCNAEAHPSDSRSCLVFPPGELVGYIWEQSGIGSNQVHGKTWWQDAPQHDDNADAGGDVWECKTLERERSMTLTTEPTDASSACVRVRVVAAIAMQLFVVDSYSYSMT